MIPTGPRYAELRRTADAATGSPRSFGLLRTRALSRRSPAALGGTDVQTAAAALLFTAAFLFTYWSLALGLIGQWATDDNYSHGFAIVPFAGYLTWRRRHELQSAPLAPSLWGLGLLCFGAVVYVVGVVGAELFLARVSSIVVLAGAVWYVLGPGHLRLLRFPLLFLLLMIPLPVIVFNQLTLPLQLFAATLGENALRAAGIPVVRDGNVLELVTMRLEVAEACSGIRSLVSLLTLAIVIGRVGQVAAARQWLLAAATVPIAILANAGRVAGTGIAAHLWGPAAAEGFLHSASGALAFGLAVTALLLLDWAMRSGRVRVS